VLESLITSKTRVKLLIKFFVNAQTKAYLRGLEDEFGDSTNGIRVELNRFEQAGLIESEAIGNRKYFKANTGHAFYNDIHQLLLKYVGIDTLIDKVISNVGQLEQAYITGDFARGVQSKVIDVMLVGRYRRTAVRLNQLIEKAESLVTFKVRYLSVTPNELDQYLKPDDPQLLVYP
jgi:hypothetical protein